jgi:hypothetical protein
MIVYCVLELTDDGPYDPVVCIVSNKDMINDRYKDSNKYEILDLDIPINKYNQIFNL